MSDKLKLFLPFIKIIYSREVIRDILTFFVKISIFITSHFFILTFFSNKFQKISKKFPCQNVKMSKKIFTLHNTSIGLKASSN